MDVEERARAVRVALDDHARQHPLSYIDPSAAADLVHWIITGDVRAFDEKADTERAEALTALIQKTGEVRTYCPRVNVQPVEPK